MDFVKCIFNFLLQIQHDINFLPIMTNKHPTSQSLLLSWYLFVQLLHLLLKFLLSKMS